jgi:hypothetical protein
MKRILMGMALAGVLVMNAFPQSGAADASDSTWGGEHIEMVMTASGAQVEFDCATGAIAEPVPLDSKTDFKLKGTLTREHGGPVRDNESSRAAAATYSGSIKEGTMHLTVTVSGKDGYQESYVLQRGHAGQLVKCR